MKAFFLPCSLFPSAEALHASSRLPSLIFSLLFLPSCPHSIHFHFPLSSLYSCFHFGAISQSFTYPYSTPLSVFSPALWQALSHLLHLSVIFSLLSFNLPFFILPTTAPFPDFSSSVGIFCLLSLNMHPFSLCHALSSLHSWQKPSKDQLSWSSLMYFPTLRTLGDWTVQVVQGQIQAHRK